MMSSMSVIFHRNVIPMVLVAALSWTGEARASVCANAELTPAVLPGHQTVSDGCVGFGTSIVALSNPQVLFLCEDSREVARFSYSGGSKGFGKRREGDLRTPLGSYPLGLPRASQIYGTFVPVGYPTSHQIRAGFTGSHIGIHGPYRRARCAGIVNVTTNWTQGCLAVATDEFIQQISEWLLRTPHGATLHIL
jgi:hypothetical protein